MDECKWLQLQAEVAVWSSEEDRISKEPDTPRKRRELEVVRRLKAEAEEVLANGREKKSSGGSIRSFKITPLETSDNALSGRN